MSAPGPHALLMLAFFFQLHCTVLACPGQEEYSLSLIVGGRPEWNPAPECYFPSKVKSMSHIWLSPWVISTQCSSARLRLCTISRVIKDRQACRAGVRSEPPSGAKRDFPLLCKHGGTSQSLRGAINWGCGSASDGTLIWLNVSSGGDKRGLLLDLWPPGRPARKTSRPECLQMPGDMGSVSCCQQAQNNVLAWTFEEQTLISS